MLTSQIVESDVIPNAVASNRRTTAIPLKSRRRSVVCYTNNSIAMLFLNNGRGVANKPTVYRLIAGDLREQVLPQ